MNGIKGAQAGRVDFFDLDWDDKSLDSVRGQFEISGRSQYVLLDADGTVLRRWFGPLNSTLSVEIDAVLAEAGY